MNDWNEDNFLEGLTPQLRLKSGAAQGPCPDAETLCAVIEGEAREPERETVIKHMSQCAACAELRNRLLNFENGTQPEPEAVWNQTRTRLDNWLEGFLRSEAARSRSPKGGKPSQRAFSWESISNLFTPRKTIWALSVALALVLIVDGVLLQEYKREQLPRGQVAVRARVPAMPNAPTPEKPPEKSTGKTRTTPREEGLPQAGANYPTRAESPSVRKAAEPIAQPKPAPAPSPEPSQISPAAQPASPVPISPSPAAPLDHNLPTETAQASVPPPANPASRAAARSPAPVLHGSRASCMTCMVAARPSVPPNAAPEAGISHPPSLRLDPASRLLIVLSSISPKPDGSFEFHGTLLLPVAQPSPVPLDRGAEVIGVGTKSQDQISLAITDLVVQGVRYTLKEGNGAMNAETPGAGGGVHFDRSQLLDMRPTALAVYDKAFEQTGQPQPQK